MKHEMSPLQATALDGRDSFERGTEAIIQTTTASESYGMYCPICCVSLRAVERAHVEIDVCPQCRGVWLDQGELDKIIARTFAAYVQTFEDTDGSHHDARRKSRRRLRLDDLLDIH